MSSRSRSLQCGQLAEEAGHSQQAAGLAEIGNVEALDGDLSARTDELPGKAQLSVVGVDSACAAEVVARVVLVHRARHVADGLVSLARQRGVDQSPVLRPDALHELGAPLGVALVPRRVSCEQPRARSAEDPLPAR